MYPHAIAIVKGEAHYEPVSDYQVRPKPSPSPTTCPRARLWTYGHRLAFALLLSQCPPDAPTHTSATQPRPNPTHSLPRTRKNVTLPCHPFPPVPHPTPPTSCPSPRLRHFSPPIRPDPAISPPLLKDTHKRATLAHARDRPCVSTALSPRTRGRAQMAVKTRLSDPAQSPLSSFATRRHFCVPTTRASITVSRGTGDTLS